MIAIHTKNSSGIPFDRAILEKMKKAIRAAVEAEYPAHRFELNILFCDDETIRGWLRIFMRRFFAQQYKYRGIDRATDVLSFPMFDFDTPELPALLGDVILSVPRAQAQAKEYGHSFEREMCFLAAHAALHLIGYDHEDEQERERMEARQREVLSSLGIER